MPIKISVDSRLIVVTTPPNQQVTLQYQTYAHSSGYLHNLYDHLIGKNRITGEEEPTSLASSWAMAPDGREWRFALKEGIPFYEMGRASRRYFFSGEDVKHTWLLQSGQLSDKAFNSYSTGPLLKGVQDVIVDGNTAVWALDTINPDLGEYLSEDWSFGIVSKEYWDNIGGEAGYEEAPIGTGAFSFVFQEIDYGMLLERNADHYRHEPHFAELFIQWVVENSTRVAMLFAGEAHVGEIPSLDYFWQEYLESAGIPVARSTLPSFQIMAVIPWYLSEGSDGTPTPNFDESAPLRNIKVREALNLAIDRNELNEVFLGGEGLPSAVPHFAEWWSSFKDEWAPIPGPTGKTGSDGGWPYPYEPERAQGLLAEAGYSSKQEIDLFAAADLPIIPELVEIAEVIALNWGDVGVNVNIHTVNFSTIQSRLATREMSGSAFMIRASLLPLSWSFEALLPGSNSPFYEHSFIVDWKEDYDGSADPVEREQLAHNLGDFLRSEHLGIPLFWAFGKAGYYPDVVDGYEVNQKTFGPVRYHAYTLPASGR